MTMAEDDDIIRTTLQQAGVKPEDLGLKIVNQKQVDKDGISLPIPR